MTAVILLEIAVKGAVVLLLAWLATRLMDRRASAAARHLVWAIALVAILAPLPGVVIFGPAWRVASLPERWVAASNALIAPSGAPHARADGEVWPATASPRSHAPLAAASGRFPSGASRPSRLLALAPTTWADWRVLLVRVWAFGACVALLRIVVGLVCAAWLARSASAVRQPDWLASHASAMARTNLTGTVRLLVSDRVGVPVAWGLVRPVIILPPKGLSWTPERQRVVLLHELAHVKRRDCLVQVLAQLAWAIHWFNPLAVVAISRVRAEQERACDDRVLKSGTSAIAYANHLCDIASEATSVPVALWATLAIARRCQLESRVNAVLDDARSRRAVSRALGVAVAALASVGVLPLGVLRPPAMAQAIRNLPSEQLNAMAPYSVLIPAPVPESMAMGRTGPETGADPASLPVRARPAVREMTGDASHHFLQPCTGCHDAVRNAGGLALDKYDVERPGDNPEIWERVVRLLRSGLHAAVGAPMPSHFTADAFCSAVEGALDRTEPANWAPGAAKPVSDSELASRLAKFLWNAEPDDTLLKLAAAGGLRHPNTLQQQVRRMVADRRSQALVQGFFGEWLLVKRVAALKPDPAVFPEFDDELRQAIEHETELFLASQVREDRGLTDLLTAKYTFLNDRLAQHYGIPNVTGTQFRRVTLTGDVRAGVLGQASVLSVTSHPRRTSPVLRGRWLMETWLGASPGPPPANVPPMKEDPDIPVRVRLEQHRKSPMCASCHATMDALGFALENFDGIGRWRDVDAGVTIDASGALPDGSRFDGPAQLRALLLERRDAIVGTITLKLLAYALGRPARYADMPAVRTIVRDAEDGGYKWSSTILGIVKSAPFQMTRID